MTNHDLYKIEVKLTHFFNKTKKIHIDTILELNLLILQLIFFHQIMKNIIIKIIINFIQAKDLVLTVLINQIFSNHTHEMNKYDNLKNNPSSYNKNINHKTQTIHNLTIQHKCITKFHCRIIYNNTEQQKVNLQTILKCQMPQNHYK